MRELSASHFLDRGLGRARRAPSRVLARDGRERASLGRPRSLGPTNHRPREHDHVGLVVSIAH